MNEQDNENKTPEENTEETSEALVVTPEEVEKFTPEEMREALSPSWRSDELDVKKITAILKAKIKVLPTSRKLNQIAKPQLFSRLTDEFVVSVQQEAIRFGTAFAVKHAIKNRALVMDKLLELSLEGKEWAMKMYCSFMIAEVPKKDTGERKTKKTLTFEEVVENYKGKK